MKIGLGGESNWTTHTESAAHHKIEASKNTSSNSKLTSFFKKKLPGSSFRSLPSAAAAPSLLSNPTHTFSNSSQVGLSSAPHIDNTPNEEFIVIDLDASDLPPSPPTIPPSTGTVSTVSLLSELEHVSISLPLSTPEGTEMDVLARFSGNPLLELEAGEDAWEMADRALNRAIGYGKTVEDIAKIIRRGPHGMDGLCKWMRTLVSELQVDEVLLEGKIKRLISAMVAV